MPEIDVIKLMNKITGDLELRRDMCTGDLHRTYVYAGYLTAMHFNNTFDLGGVTPSEDLVEFIATLGPGSPQWKFEDIQRVVRNFLNWTFEKSREATDNKRPYLAIAYMDIAEMLTVGVVGSERRPDDGNLAGRLLREYQAMLES